MSAESLASNLHFHSNGQIATDVAAACCPDLEHTESVPICFNYIMSLSYTALRCQGYPSQLNISGPMPLNFTFGTIYIHLSRTTRMWEAKQRRRLENNRSSQHLTHSTHKPSTVNHRWDTRFSKRSSGFPVTTEHNISLLEGTHLL